MKRGYLYIILATVFFSSMEVALKVISNTFNPLQMNFLRFTIGSLVLLPLALRNLKKRNAVLNYKDYAFFALTGFICVVVSMGLYQMAILYSQASIVAILFSCNPVFVVIFAYIMLDEKIYKHTVISIILSLLGIITIMNPFKESGNFLGISLTILSAITFALYGVVGRTQSDKYGGVALTCFSFLFGSAEMVIFILLTKLEPVAKFFENIGLQPFAHVPFFSGINLSSLPGLIYVGIFVTGFGYAFYFLAMEATSAATASLVFYIKPVLAPILALIFIKEPITIPMAIGIALIIVGSIITFIPGMKMQKSLKADNPAG